MPYQYDPESSGALATALNALNRTAQGQANVARIPNALGLEQVSSGNIASLLKGQVPTDVLNLLGQQSGELTTAQGLYSSPAGRASYLRALGLTSLDMQDRGQKYLTEALGRNPAAPLVDPLKTVITPYEQARLDLERREQDTRAALERDRMALERQRIAEGTAARNAMAGGGTVSASPGPTGQTIFATGGGMGGYSPTASGSYWTGAGTYGSLGQQIAGGTYVDPSTGNQWVRDDISGGWYNWDTGQTSEFPTGLTGGSVGMTADEWALPYEPGYQPTGQGTMYMGDTGGYYTNDSVDAFLNNEWF